MVYPRSQFRELSEHCRRKAHATFQPKRFVETNVRDDHDFDVLVDNFGRDHV